MDLITYENDVAILSNDVSLALKEIERQLKNKKI